MRGYVIVYRVIVGDYVIWLFVFCVYPFHDYVYLLYRGEVKFSVVSQCRVSEHSKLILRFFALFSHFKLKAKRTS